MKTGFLTQWQTSYSIKEGYKWLQGESRNVPWSKWVWNRYNIPKHSVIAWMATLGKLITKAHLFGIGVVTEKMCLMCGLQEESIEHCFFQRKYSLQCYVKICRRLKLSATPMDHINSSWKKWSRKYACKRKKSTCLVVLAALVYQIWCARNCAYWEKRIPRPEVLVDNVMHSVCNRVRQLINSKWSQGEKDWLEELARIQ
ncbi:uncharacterized protein LOC104899492 [Beta vulgaris subsp. vulgaris]|uniref:uncharacterized protein LOC104899492 n=1 Tax=Beta vulgaris subsp. vulgaris TaxID=3555 RepID=UPI0020368CAA|nr:uncharacterized protein LOC104899492 [Beta vulgaris subsp. vulgaris]